MITTAPFARLVAVGTATVLLLTACAAPGESPATPADTPADTPAVTAGQTPAETPAVTPGETPAGTPGETPGETPAGTPGETPGETPAGTPGETGAPPPSGASGELFAFGVTRAEADEIATVRLDYFEELNPDVTLTVSESGFDEAAFLTALQTDQPPDVVRMDNALIATYVARGVLQPVDSCFEQWGIPTDKYYQSRLDQATVDGQLYGVPESMDTRNWLLNDESFTAAGLDPATFDFSDWDAIRSANEAMLQANGGVTALGIDPKVPEFFPLWAKANGVDLISADGTTAQLDQPGAAEALELAVDLIDAHGGSSPFFDFRGTWDFFGANNQFQANQVGAHPMEQWYLNVLAGSSPDAGVTARAFVDRQGNGLTFASGSAFAIPTASTNPEAACTFALVMSHEEAYVRAAQERKRIRDESGEANTGVFTANRIANERIFSEVVPPADMPAPWGDAVQVYLDNWDNSFALPPSPANQAIFFGDQSVVSQAVARALGGEDPATVLAEANAEAQDAIDQAQR